MGRWGYRISIRYLTSESPYLHVLIYCILFRPKGVDIVGGDINGLSTRIHVENEANVQFLKQDQNARYVVASCFFVSFFFVAVLPLPSRSLLPTSGSTCCA